MKDGDDMSYESTLPTCPLPYVIKLYIGKTYSLIKKVLFNTNILNTSVAL